MTKRTLDIAAPYGYGRKYPDTPNNKVPLKYLRDIARRSNNAEAKAHSLAVLDALGESRPEKTATTTKPKAAASPKATGPAKPAEGPAPSATQDQLDALAAQPAGEYTLVYSRVCLWNTKDGARVKIQRGETIHLSTADIGELGYLMCKFVRGDLSPDHIANLLKAAKGGVPKPSGAIKHSVQAVDYKNAQPVKDQTASHPASTVNLPDYQSMEFEELFQWAINTEWVQGDFGQITKKPELVEFLLGEQARVNQVEKLPAEGPGGPLEDV